MDMHSPQPSRLGASSLSSPLTLSPYGISGRLSPGDATNRLRSKRRYGVNRQIVDDFASVISFAEGEADFVDRAVEGVWAEEAQIIYALHSATAQDPVELPTAEKLGISQAELDILHSDMLSRRLEHGSAQPGCNMYTMDFITHILAPFRNPDLLAYAGNAPFYLAGTDAGTFKPDFFAGVPAFHGVVSHSGGVSLPALFMGKAEGNPENDFYRVAIWQAQAISHQEKFVADFFKGDSRLMHRLPVKLPFSCALYVDGAHVTLSIFLVVRWKLRWIVFKPIDCSKSRDRLLVVLVLLLEHIKLWSSCVEAIRDGTVDAFAGPINDNDHDDTLNTTQQSLLDSSMSPSQYLSPPSPLYGNDSAAGAGAGKSGHHYAITSRTSGVGTDTVGDTNELHRTHTGTVSGMANFAAGARPSPPRPASTSPHDRGSPYGHSSSGRYNDQPSTHGGVGVDTLSPLSSVAAGARSLHNISALTPTSTERSATVGSSVAYSGGGSDNSGVLYDATDSRHDTTIPSPSPPNYRKTSTPSPRSSPLPYRSTPSPLPPATQIDSTASGDGNSNVARPLFTAPPPAPGSVADTNDDVTKLTQEHDRAEHTGVNDGGGGTVPSPTDVVASMSAQQAHGSDIGYAKTTDTMEEGSVSDAVDNDAAVTDASDIGPGFKSPVSKAAVFQPVWEMYPTPKLEPRPSPKQSPSVPTGSTSDASPNGGNDDDYDSPSSSRHNAAAMAIKEDLRVSAGSAVGNNTMSSPSSPPSLTSLGENTQPAAAPSLSPQDSDRVVSSGGPALTKSALEMPHGSAGSTRSIRETPSSGSQSSRGDLGGGSHSSRGDLGGGGDVSGGRDIDPTQSYGRASLSQSQSSIRAPSPGVGVGVGLGATRTTSSPSRNEPKYVLKDPSCYRAGKVIHHTPASTVCEATLRADGTNVVVKIVPAAYAKRGMNEVNILRKHSLKGLSCLVKMLGHFKSSNGDYHIVFAKVPCKEAHYKPRNAEQVRLYIRTLLEAILELHERNVVHADIKETNCLFDEVAQHVVLIDFGLATLGPVFYGSRGSSGYASPEMHVDGNRLTAAVDVFSAGVIMANMIFGCRISNLTEAMSIANAKSLDQARNAALNGCDYSTRQRRRQLQDALCSLEAFDLVKELLMHDAISRITVKDALQHHYFTGKAGPKRIARPPSQSSVRALQSTLASGAYPPGHPNHRATTPRLGQQGGGYR